MSERLRNKQVTNAILRNLEATFQLLLETASIYYRTLFYNVLRQHVVGSTDNLTDIVAQ